MQYEVVGCIVRTDIQLSLYDLLTCMACSDSHHHHHEKSANPKFINGWKNHEIYVMSDQNYKKNKVDSHKNSQLK